MNAVRVIAHRRSNPHVYPPSEGQWFDENSVAQEILQQKFTTNPELFVGQPDRIPGMVMHQPSAPALSAVCTCGANDWEPQFCRTCGGNKINGYKCRKCGHPRSK